MNTAGASSGARPRRHIGRRGMARLNLLVVVLVAIGGLTASPAAASAGLFAWGQNNGALGDGTEFYRGTPEPISLPEGVAAASVSAGSPSLAIGTDGKLYGWGTDFEGNEVNVPTLITLPGGVGARAASAGGPSLVIGTDGQLYAWGDNTFGELGDGTTTSRTSPEPVNLPHGVEAAAISAGGGSSFAIGTDGNLYGWGANYIGQLGDGSFTQLVSAPELISLPGGVTPAAVLTAYGSTFAIGTDGNLYAWGYNDYGELGDGTTTSRDVPEQINLPSGAGVSAVTTSRDVTLALGDDGHVYGWGDNVDFALADGTLMPHYTPELIPLPGGIRARAVSAGFAPFNLAVGSDGRLYAWGRGCCVGDGNQFGDRSVPEPIPLPGNVSPTEISAGSGFAFALHIDPPEVSATAPVEGASYDEGQYVVAGYSCADDPNGPGLSSCTGSVPVGSPIHTSTPGPHTFTITAISRDGNRTSETVHYTVTAPAGAPPVAPAGGPTSQPPTTSPPPTPPVVSPPAPVSSVPSPGCPLPTGRLSGRTLGPLRLGMTRGQARGAFAHSSDRGQPYEDFFCLTPNGVRVGYASPKLIAALPRSERGIAGRVVWVSTANRYYGVEGIRPEAPLAAAARVLRLAAPLHIGLNYWYLAPAGAVTAVLKVRHGVIQEVGIADKRFTATRAMRLIFMTSFW
jgi:alpha-tubulin suppressor-like RCC1 family protein